MNRPVSLFVLALFCAATSASATPDFIYHDPISPVYGEASSVTMREPDSPRETEEPAIWVKIGYSFWYTDVAVYYTTDGSTPAGSFGVSGSPSTQVLRSSSSGLTFVRNEPGGPGNIDWWRGTLPANIPYNSQVKYVIGAWHSGGGGEVFANNSGCADGTCDNPAAPKAVYQFRMAIAWPGRGHPNASPSEGYPAVHFWKEEAVAGNNWMNVQVDQNGSIYDIYYPSAGCIQGMGTKNEGYVDGLDTFPPGLPLGSRGQMNTNIGMPGIRYNGVTYWLSNEGGAYSGVTQTYLPDTNTVRTSQTLTAGGANIFVDQYDFCPKGVAYPLDSSGEPNRGIYIKRVLLTNSSQTAATIDFYFYMDPALNGGDGYDAMFYTASPAAMTAYDNTFRETSNSGEYNPTFFPSYSKNVSVYLSSAVKVLDSVGGSSGEQAKESWRDSSADSSQGWIGSRLTIGAGQTREVDVAVIGGYKQQAGDPGPTPTFDGQIVPALNWFYSNSMKIAEDLTNSYWSSWLSSGVTIDLPGTVYDNLYNRSMLATALHLDEKGGGVVAGMHNGAYPFVWPRDAVYAAITLDRTGHVAEAENVYRFLREVCSRDYEEPGRKGFFYQKYTTDGYRVWTAPQVDETAAVPWGVKYHYDVTGSLPFLNQNWQMVYESARSSSEDSNISSQLFYDDANKLMHSNNVWEDSFDDFLYSNASVERALRDAASIATALGKPADAATFSFRANDLIHQGILGRLAWDGENTDISQLGLTYPFDVLPANSSQMLHLLARMNGTASDRWGNNHPIINTSGEWEGLVNRYWGDSYWNGGPWFLTTLWYGQHYAKLQNHFPGKSYIDVHKDKIDRVIGELGPAGLGAEQIAPSWSLLYPGQTDFVLQAAWPNAWESMSTIADSLMLFLDFRPDAAAGKIYTAPKLPSSWPEMTFRNLRVGSNRVTIAVKETPQAVSESFTNLTPANLQFETWLRVPAGNQIAGVEQDGADVPYTYESSAGRVKVTGSLYPTAGSVTTVTVYLCEECQPATVSQIRTMPAGTQVALADVIVTRVLSNRFNVSEPDRSAGIAVIGTGVAEGEKVRLKARVSQDGPERVLTLEAVLDQEPAQQLKPLNMNGAVIGGSTLGAQGAPSDGIGLNNVGLLARLYGRVGAVAPDRSWAVIDDGAARANSSGHQGVKVYGPVPVWLAPGDFVWATGVVSLEQSAETVYAILRVARAADIQQP